MVWVPVAGPGSGVVETPHSRQARAEEAQGASWGAAEEGDYSAPMLSVRVVSIRSAASPSVAVCTTRCPSEVTIWRAPESTTLHVVSRGKQRVVSSAQ